MNIDYERIGSRIKFRRVKNGVSQEELADQVGVSRVHISCIERGTRIPSLEAIISIANSLNVSTDELLSDSLFIAKHREKQQYDDLLDCTQEEIEILLQSLSAIKNILRSYQISK